MVKSDTKIITSLLLQSSKSLIYSVLCCFVVKAKMIRWCESSIKTILPDVSYMREPKAKKRYLHEMSICYQKNATLKSALYVRFCHTIKSSLEWNKNKQLGISLIASCSALMTLPSGHLHFWRVGVTNSDQKNKNSNRSMFLTSPFIRVYRTWPGVEKLHTLKL